MTLHIAEHLREIAADLGINVVFKASYDKANRSSGGSFRGMGMEKGLRISARTPTENLPEIMELPSHPFFIGVQFHPEFTSTPRGGHPLFRAFIEAAIAFRQRRLDTPLHKVAA